VEQIRLRYSNSEFVWYRLEWNTVCNRVSTFWWSRIYWRNPLYTWHTFLPEVYFAVFILDDLIGASQ